MPDGETWRPENATPAELQAIIVGALEAAAREEIDGPHLVICRDADGDFTSYSGPYPDGLSALLAADLEAARSAADAEAPEVVYSVAALLPPETAPAPADRFGHP